LVAVDALYTYLDILFMLQADESEEKQELAEKLLITYIIIASGNRGSYNQVFQI
jgi:hypothetical protein